MQKITRRAGVAIVAVFVAACSGPSAPIPPTATPSPVSGATVSGVVVEGTIPIGDARVRVWYGGYIGLGPSVVADANGAFRLTNVPQGTTWLVAFKYGYAQPCAVPATVQGDATVNVQLIAQANLTAASTLSSPAGSRTVSGVVVQMTDTGKQPVAGASVLFEPAPLVNDWVVANTYSDANGRFFLCGLPQDAAWISVAKGDRSGYVTAQPGQNDIEITLR